MNAAGEFVVSWSEYDETEQRTVVLVQRFHADGTQATGVLRVAQGSSAVELTFNPRSVGNHDVGIDAAGNFVVLWRDASMVTSIGDIRLAKITLPACSRAKR